MIPTVLRNKYWYPLSTEICVCVYRRLYVLEDLVFSKILMCCILFNVYPKDISPQDGIQGQCKVLLSHDQNILIIRI